MRGTRDLKNHAVGANAVSLINAIFRWCEFTKGSERPEAALSALVEGIDGQAIALSRVKRRENVIANAIFFDELGSRSNLPRIDKSYASRLLGSYVATVRPGTAWLRSAIETETDPDLDVFHRRRGFKEFGVIPLSVEGNSADFIELHFAEQLTPEQHALVNTIAGTLSSAWSGRASGTFVESVLDRKPKPENRPMSGKLVLGLDNPFGLSRMEFRVCACLSRGLSKQAVCEEVGMSNSTIRTHRSNVYAKTATESLAQLVYLLVDRSWISDIKINRGQVA